MKQTLILDLGGVCVYPAFGNWNIPVNHAEVLGGRDPGMLSAEFAAADREAGRIMDESLLLSEESQEYALRVQYYEAVDRALNWRLAPAEIEKLAYSAAYDDARTVFYPDVLPWLRVWKQKMQLGVLSDAMPSIMRIMEHAGMLALLDGAVISTRVGALKPSPRMYSAISELLGADPRSCIFVDDKPRNLEGAQSFGMRAIQMLRKNCMPDALWPGESVHDFEELNALL